jgi:hypothetical protein
MNLRFSCFAVLAWWILRGSTPALAAIADEKRLVVVEPSTSTQLSKNAKERLRNAISEVVTRNGILLVPAATLGLMAATEEATKGRFPMPSVLLSAFRVGRQRARAMLLLGAIYTAGSLLATQLAMLLAGDQPAAEGELDFTGLLALALHTPLFLMFWHAPALVHWHGVTPVKSLFFSMVACMKNFGAFAVYGLGWIGVFLTVGGLFALLGGLIGGQSMARAMMMPVALLMAAMFSTSIYFTFRDSFVATPEPQSPPEPEESP